MHAQPELIVAPNLHLIPAKDKEFVLSLLDKQKKYGLSPKQQYWLSKFADMVLAQQADKALIPPEAPAREIVCTRLLAMFAAVAKKLKNPRWVLHLEDGSPLQLKQAGAASKSPGVINVTDGGGFASNTWYGRIRTDGTWEPTKSMTPEQLAPVTALVSKLACDPCSTLEEHGVLTQFCALCNTPLTDPKSLKAGYGPICAARWSLPWGKKS